MVSRRKFKQMPIIGRESESDLIEKQINSFINTGISNIIYLTGVPGSGKTYTAVSLLNSCSIPFSYINCSVLKRKNEIYGKIYSNLHCTKSIDKTKIRKKRSASKSASEVAIKKSPQSLRLHFSNCQFKHIILIDEVDFLINKNENFLYNLFEMPFIQNSQILLIVISNTLGSLSGKVESRIGKNRIEFKPYTSDQLLLIAKNNKTNNKSKNNAKNDIVEVVAKRIASSTGDIRKLNEVMKNPLSSDFKNIQTILKNMNTPLLCKFVNSMNFYQKLILYLNKEAKNTIFEWFDHFKTYCLIRNYPPLDFSDFMRVVHELVGFDIYKIKKDGIQVNCMYLKEELEQAIKDDATFNEFKKLS